MRFFDKVVLVTGGNSGIGRAAALAFAREGAKVIIAARRDNLGNEVVNTIKQHSGEAIFAKTDVTRPEDIDNLFNFIRNQYGRLDCAFNNAGIGTHIVKRAANMTLEEWEPMINTNLRGVWLCMVQEIRLMLKQGKGVIVNTASMAGVAADIGMSIYVASKHGVMGLTKAAALDYAHKNIRINAVCPGFINTPMLYEPWQDNPKLMDLTLDRIPMGHFGEPEEVAGAVLWLCSDEASFMTGREIVIGGGQTLRV
jgi:NAD(P)-dependent dehydrogenase (short-subunit alcohol dehydrogenase family)